MSDYDILQNSQPPSLFEFPAIWLNADAAVTFSLYFFTITTSTFTLFIIYANSSISSSFSSSSSTYDIFILRHRSFSFYLFSYKIALNYASCASFASFYNLSRKCTLSTKSDNRSYLKSDLCGDFRTVFSSAKVSIISLVTEFTRLSFFISKFNFLTFCYFWIWN